IRFWYFTRSTSSSTIAWSDTQYVASSLSFIMSSNSVLKSASVSGTSEWTYVKSTSSRFDILRPTWSFEPRWDALLALRYLMPFSMAMSTLIWSTSLGGKTPPPPTFWAQAAVTGRHARTVARMSIRFIGRLLSNPYKPHAPGDVEGDENPREKSHAGWVP